MRKRIFQGVLSFVLAGAVFFFVLPQIADLEEVWKQIQAMTELEIDPEFAERSVNEGFSGGEKKRHEILQLSLLKPKIAILDETDSGLDVDALRVVAEGVNRYKAESANGEGVGIMLITHYTRILRYIHPDRVHVFAGGMIVESGGPDLADELEATGYVRFVGAPAAAI